MSMKISVNEIKADTWGMWIQSDFASPVSFGWMDTRSGEKQYYNVEFPWVDVVTNNIISDEEAVALYGVNNIREFIVDAYHNVLAYKSRKAVPDVDLIALWKDERDRELSVALGDRYDSFVAANIEYQKAHPELYSGLIIGQ